VQPVGLCALPACLVDGKMKVAFFLNVVSPHQLPLARAVARRVGEGNFIYVYAEPFYADRAKMGWDAKDMPSWCMWGGEDTPCLMDADVVYTGIRCLNLMEKRCALGKKTYYCSERWFKPPVGWLRLFAPRYFMMARRFVRLAKADGEFRLLPIGVHARRDFSLLGIPEHKMTTWGYFVAPANRQSPTACRQSPISPPLRVLWVGRMLKLKHVDTIIKAITRLNLGLDAPKFTLTLVGDGPEQGHLRKLAAAAQRRLRDDIGDVFDFRASVPIGDVRNLMRGHDVYVFASNGYDGWGAVVSEAMEEGMFVIGSNQAGASATMLPHSHRFDCKDDRRLAVLLHGVADGKLTRIPIGDWTADKAAERLLAL